mgnify:CR=1 FL=1
MCIRDSPGPMRRPGDRRAGTLPGGCVPGNCGSRPLPRRCPGACLLYTSDAADDLLCVDLGGRRIIKKKKKIQKKNTYTRLCAIEHQVNDTRHKTHYVTDIDGETN